MDPALVVSPHADDAALGCGQFLAGRPDALVATVFAGSAVHARMQTTYDRDCGFANASAARAARLAEDTAALAVLDAHGVHLTYPDHQYREVEGTFVDPDDIAADLLALADGDPLITVAVGPLGLAHPDHLATAAAFQILATERPELQCWLYEELPARVWWPEQVPARLDRWRDARFDPVEGFLGTGPLDVKETAVRCYGSQLWALGEGLHAVLVPERYWRLRPVTP